MASFREHVAIGALLSVAAVVGVYVYAILTDPLLLCILFAVTIVGSFLPDVDSDEGLPFYIVFGAVTVLITGAALYFAFLHYPNQLYVLVLTPIAAMLLSWFGLGTIVKHFTHHRGIYHSLPAMAIAALLTYIVAKYFQVNELISLILAGGMALGFASHLILDEVHSEVNLDGNPFVPKHSLGTALKLFSNSHTVNVCTYVLLAGLAYIVFRP